MGIKFTKKPGEAVTSKQIKSGKQIVAEDSATEQVEAPGSQEGPASQLCEVCVDMSFTKNMGNYQSARVGVSLKIPCNHPEIDEVFDYAKNWADARLAGMVAELEDGGEG